MELEKKIYNVTMQAFSRWIYDNEFKLLEKFLELGMMTYKMFCFSGKKMSMFCDTIYLCILLCIYNSFFDNLNPYQTRSPTRFESTNTYRSTPTIQIKHSTFDLTYHIQCCCEENFCTCRVGLKK